MLGCETSLRKWKMSWGVHTHPPSSTLIHPHPPSSTSLENPCVCSRLCNLAVQRSSLTIAPFISLNTTPLNVRGDWESFTSSCSSLQPSCLASKKLPIRKQTIHFWESLYSHAFPLKLDWIIVELIWLTSPMRKPQRATDRTDEITRNPVRQVSERIQHPNTLTASFWNLWDFEKRMDTLWNHFLEIKRLDIRIVIKFLFIFWNI